MYVQETPVDSNSSAIQNTKSSSSFSIYIIYIFAAIFIIFDIAIFLYFKKTPQLAKASVDQIEQLPIAAKVGEENIYQKDLDLAVSLYPATPSAETRKFILEKIVTDSIILQGAQTDGLMTLDETVYNSSSTDYLKRTQLVKKMSDQITQEAKKISGAVITIWFINDQSGKQAALDKITKLHDDLKSSKITLAQAGDAIKNDPNFAKLDSAYQQKSVLEFKNRSKGLEFLGSDTVTFDKGIDSLLWNLNEGEVSKVNLIQYQDPNATNMSRRVDAAYVFAHVTKISGNNKIASFEDWLAQKRKVYEVKYY